jgi:RNA polymerase sigma factor (sigma-70 family)
VSAGEIIRGPRGKHRVTAGGVADWDADRALTALYGRHYPPLVRLASLLVQDTATAEEVVQDSFVALRASRRRLQDSDGALCYLRQSVLNRSRLALRHRDAPGRKVAEPAAGPRAAGERPVAGPDPSPVISALRALPARRREALVMRYYADLPEEQVAETMGISQRAVRQHTARAMAALRAGLGAADDQAAAGFLVH